MVRAALVVVLVATACTGTSTTTTSPTAGPTARPPTTAPQPTTTAGASTTMPACPDLVSTEPGESFDAVLAVYELPGGAQHWMAPLGTLPGPVGVPFVATEEAVVLPVRDRVVALDAATCEPRWDAPAGRLLDLAAGPSGEIAVLDSLALRMRDGATGEQRWSWGYRWEPPEPPPRVAWLADALVVTTPDRELVVLDLATGAERLRAQVPASGFLSAPLVAGERALVSHDSVVTALSLADGAPQWEADVGFHIYPGVAADGDAVFVVSSEDATIAALDAASGAVRWRRTVAELLKFEAPPVLRHGEIHVLDSEQRLHHLDPADGSTIFVGDHRSDRTTWAPADGLVLRQGGGAVTGLSMLERQVWEFRTGANPPGRISLVEVGPGYAATLTFDTSPP